MSKPIWPDKPVRGYSRPYMQAYDEAERSLASGVRRFYVYRQREGDTAAQASEAVQAEVAALLDALERGQ